MFQNTTNINKPNGFFDLLIGKHKEIFFDYIHKLNKDNKLAAENYDDELTLNTHASIFCMLNFLQLYKFENLNKLKEIVNVINVTEKNSNTLPMKIFLNNNYNKMTLPMNEQNLKNADYLDEYMNIFNNLCNNLNLNDDFYLCDMYSSIFEEKVNVANDVVSSSVSEILQQQGKKDEMNHNDSDELDDIFNQSFSQDDFINLFGTGSSNSEAALSRSAFWEMYKKPDDSRSLADLNNGELAELTMLMQDQQLVEKLKVKS